jgi:hypothetical protein
MLEEDEGMEYPDGEDSRKYLFEDDSVICGYISANGVCAGKSCNKNGSDRCKRHTCTKDGCSTEKKSTTQFCLVHECTEVEEGLYEEMSPDIDVVAVAKKGADRMLDAQDEDGGVRSPISGLFPTDLPIPTSLEAALKPAAADIPTCAKLIALATRKAETLKGTYPHIAPHMLAAVVLYTMEEIPKKNSPYYCMNNALRDRSRTNVRKWRVSSIHVPP